MSAYSQGSWWQTTDHVEFLQYLRALPTLVPPSAILYMSGHPGHSVVRDIIRRSRVPLLQRKMWLPAGDHIWATKGILDDLRSAIENVGEKGCPTLVHVYEHRTLILLWHDASWKDSRIHMSKRLPEEQVRAFCAELKCGYQVAELESRHAKR